MNNPATRWIEADIRTPLGEAHAVQSSWPATIDSCGTPKSHWLEMSLLPLPAGVSGCFPEQWGAHRYEPVGALFLLPARRPVRVRSECRRQSSIVCGLTPEAIGPWLGEELEWTDARLSGALDIATPIVRQLMLRLGEELRTPGFAREAMIELIMGQIAIELGRYLLAIERGQPKGGLAPWRLKLIDERLSDRAVPSLGELAGLCGLSVRQLARGFRTSRGRSIGAHIAARGIEHARELLAGDTPLKQVSHALGFGSPSNFSVAFRRGTGETPSDYRLRERRNTAVPARPCPSRLAPGAQH